MGMVLKRLEGAIPVVLSEKDFNEFVLPHLRQGTRGPEKKISDFKIFNYILKFLHTGCQWSNIPIDKDANGRSEIHYTRIFKRFKSWVGNGSFDNIFASSVLRLHESHKLDLSVLHGDGTSTAAKKGVTI